jgi:hypothetical protein
MPIKYHTVGLTSGRCRSSQELSEIGTPCHLTKPAWTHLKLLKLQSVSNKPPRLLLSFNLFLTYPDARLPLMHSTYLNHCMIFDTTKEAVNRQKQKTFLSFQIGQLYLVCGCMTIRRCVTYCNDLRGTLTSRSNNCFLNSIFLSGP